MLAIARVKSGKLSLFTGVGTVIIYMLWFLILSIEAVTESLLDF